MQDQLTVLTETLEKLSAQVAALTTQLSEQQNRIEQLEAALQGKESSNSNGPTGSQNLPHPQATNSKNASRANSTRRQFLGKLGVGLVAGSLISSFAVSNTEARLILNPAAYPNQFGAIVMPQGFTYSGQPPSTTGKYGLVASANSTLNLADIPVYDTGLVGVGNGYGVYGICYNRQGYGLYGYNLASSGTGSGYGVYGVSNLGIGVGGYSQNNTAVYGNSGSAAGVYGYTNTGSGLFGYGGSGVPLTLYPSATPSAGTRQIGDVYVDSTGKLYAWAKNDAGTTSNWRQLAFAT